MNDEAIEEYRAKIEALDAKLAQFKAQKLNEVKREAMRKMNYTDEQIDRYVKYIEGETKDEIERSVLKLASDIPPRNRAKYVDPAPMNGLRSKPRQKEPGEIGKSVFERIKEKVFSGGRVI